MNKDTAEKVLNHIEIKIGLFLINVIVMSYLTYNQSSMSISELFYNVLIIWLLNLAVLWLGRRG